MKKLLFILILLMPFVIKAESDFSMAKMWDSELFENYSGNYILNGKYIKVSEYELVSVDALTGEKHTVNISSERNIKYAVYNDQLLTITQARDNTNTFITLYNENLTQLSRETIEYFDIDHIRMYNNKYIILSGDTSTNGDYTRYVYFIDSEGKIYKSDKVRTLNYTEKYINEADNTFYYKDVYDNTYTIDNYKIVSNNQNSDGSYIVNYNNSIIKFNSNDEKVKEIHLPTGQDPKIVKKGNSYYVIAHINTISNSHYAYKVILYKMDGNLNLSEPSEVFPEDFIETPNMAKPIDINYKYYNLYNINNKVYMVLRISGSYSYYVISDDLTITPSDGVTVPYHSKSDLYRYVTVIYESNKLELNPDIPTKDINQILLETFPKGEDEGGKNFKIIFDKDNNAYINILSFKNYSGETKLELAKVDSSGNVIFKKTIYNQAPIFETSNGCTQTPTNNIAFFEDYIVVAASSTQKNIIKFYDKQGNEIYDLSQDVDKFPRLSFKGMKLYERGIYFELDNNYHCKQGVSEIVKNNNGTLVLEAMAPTTSTYMAFYELPFLVNTKVKGGGTVTAKQIRALTGARVEFTVTPDPGYVLSVVKVTDANGNVLTFTNNTFVMPSSDVIIEATFVPINPNTKSFISYAILGICVIAGLSTVILSSKKKQYE